MSNERIELHGKKKGQIGITSHKWKIFEIEVVSSDGNRYSIIIPEDLMYIVHRAVEYEGSLSGKRAILDFDSKTIMIFIQARIAITIRYDQISIIASPLD